MEVNEYSALNLAYLGDAVFELYARTYLLSEGNAPTGKINVRAKDIVSAKAQSDMYFKIYDMLTDEEKAVIRRGRNAKTYTRAKNTDLISYRHATGLEALFGYLYLKGSTERLEILFRECTGKGRANENQTTNEIETTDETVFEGSAETTDETVFEGSGKAADETVPEGSTEATAEAGAEC